MMANDMDDAWATGAEVDAGVLLAVLNEVDYGLAVVDAHSRRLLYANMPARQALSPESTASVGLCVQDGRLTTCAGVSSRPLDLALERARMRLRGLLSLDQGKARTTLAFMPMQTLRQLDLSANALACQVLLVFAKPRLCDATTVTLFAREHGLSCVEGQVLAQLCQGLRPNDIAERHEVQVSTVRTQMRSIRQKTGASNLRELVKEVAMLPSLSRHLPWDAAAPVPPRRTQARTPGASVRHLHFA